MSTGVWHKALANLKRLHQNTAALQTFAPFPDDLIETEYTPLDHAVYPRFWQEDFSASPEAPFIDTLKTAGGAAHWRQTYKDTDIGGDFMARFGCYCLIGPEAPWTSASMFAFLVYMPAHLWYPWHHHPAEELYFVLGGAGTFLRHGEPAERLGAGGASFHASNQPHALETTDDPVLALVYWRNHFETPPVLSPEDMLQ